MVLKLLKLQQFCQAELGHGNVSYRVCPQAFAWLDVAFRGKLVGARRLKDSIPFSDYCVLSFIKEKGDSSNP